ncbi:MAG: glycoside hydrolase family 43 protein [Anaerolineae bacterium]|nr:glycoside hydrolase family 43 protein [Anaerolineae bacterium]
MDTYTNPVYDQYFADPFVLYHEGHYYAYGTAAPLPDGTIFPVLQSPDLVHWQLRGGALIPPGGDDFWAPEAAYHNGTFYLYYSAHGINGKDHQLRVATSPNPLGPFHDAGHVLVPNEPFTIDAHPFRDVDGQWYLFYSQDFLTLDEDYRVGTGIVVDRLLDMQTLAGQPRVVARPHADWHLFQAQRTMYGNVYDWHTIEGAAVRVHNDKYYCFYSGGAWERENYGIAYVIADQPLGPYRRPEGVTLPLMRSVPGQVIGPGHNSFTSTPDGKQEVVVYHAWDTAMTARLMRVDRLHWDGDRPVIDGPTYTPQPVLIPHLSSESSQR